MVRGWTADQPQALVLPSLLGPAPHTGPGSNPHGPQAPRPPSGREPVPALTAYQSRDIWKEAHGVGSLAATRRADLTRVSFTGFVFRRWGPTTRGISGGPAGPTSRALCSLWAEAEGTSPQAQPALPLRGGHQDHSPPT